MRTMIVLARTQPVLTLHILPQYVCCAMNLMMLHGVVPQIAAQPRNLVGLLRGSTLVERAAMVEVISALVITLAVLGFNAWFWHAGAKGM